MTVTLRNTGAVVPSQGESPAGGWGGENTAALVALDTSVGVLVGEPTGVDDTSAVLDAISRVNDGGLIDFYDGEYAVNLGAIASAKAFTMRGRGNLSTWLVPRAAGSAAMVEFALPSTSPTGSNRGWYGAGMRDMGIDLYGAPGATGVLVPANAGWVKVENYWCQGGTRSVDWRGANGKLINADLVDAATFLRVDMDTAAELRVFGGSTNRNTAGTTALAIDIFCTNTASKGAVYITDLHCNSGSTGGVSTTAGMKVSAPGFVSLPVICTGLHLDNITGGGPGVELVNVGDFIFANGWINCGAASGGPAVRLNGCQRPKFTGNTMFGGAAGGTAKTYDFTGAVTDAFTSVGNMLPTNWIYYLPSANKPTAMFVEDNIGLGGGIRIDTSNDMPGLLAATANRSGQRRFMDQVIFCSPPTFSEAEGASELGTLVSGGVEIEWPGVSPATSVFLPFYVTPIGTTGALRVAGINATGGPGGTGSVSIVSTKGDGTTQTADASLVAVLRFERGS